MANIDVEKLRLHIIVKGAIKGSTISLWLGDQFFATARKFEGEDVELATPPLILEDEVVLKIENPDYQTVEKTYTRADFKNGEIIFYARQESVIAGFLDWTA